MLTRQTVIALSFLAFAPAIAAPALAQDASYDSTMQITGGTLVDTMKQLSFMKSVKEMLAPTVTTTIVRGNQKAQISKESIEITDLDKETITRIDNVKKTYTVTTFADMRQAFAAMPAQMDKMQAQMKQAQAQQAQAQAQAQAQPGPPPPDFKMTYDVSAKNTGVTKVVNGQNAQEQVVTLSMHLTDPNSPLAPGTNPITYTMTTDVWIAPDPPELLAVRAFDMRFGQKLMQGVDMSAMASQMKSMQAQSAGMAQLFAGQPGAMQAMTQMGEELAKIKGTRIMETTSMGGLAPAPPPGQAAAPASSTPNSVGGVAGQVASDTATQTAQGESGKMGVFGNALTNSALSAFKKKPKPAPAPTPAPAAAAGTPPGMQNVILMSTTTQLTNFSQNPGPSSAFQIPAGYTKITMPAR